MLCVPWVSGKCSADLSFLPQSSGVTQGAVVTTRTLQVTRLRLRRAHGLPACEREARSRLVRRRWKSHQGTCPQEAGTAGTARLVGTCWRWGGSWCLQRRGAPKSLVPPDTRCPRTCSVPGHTVPPDARYPRTHSAPRHTVPPDTRRPWTHGAPRCTVPPRRAVPPDARCPRDVQCPKTHGAPRHTAPQAHISLPLKSSPEISFFVGLHLPCRFNGCIVSQGPLHAEDIQALFTLADKSCPFQQQGVKSDFPRVFSGHKLWSWCLPGRKPKRP